MSMSDTSKEALDALERNADALLDLDAKGVLVPHGIGGLARGIIGQQHAAITALRAERDHWREGYDYQCRQTNAYIGQVNELLGMLGAENHDTQKVIEAVEAAATERAAVWLETVPQTLPNRQELASHIRALITPRGASVLAAAQAPADGRLRLSDRYQLIYGQACDRADLDEAQGLNTRMGMAPARVPNDFLTLVSDAMAEAERAMQKHPQPNYVISKLAEEAGETVKAAIHHAEGRETREAVVGEMRQTIAMMLRLWIEGDQVHGMRALATDALTARGEKP